MVFLAWAEPRSHRRNDSDILCLLGIYKSQVATASPAWSAPIQTEAGPWPCRLWAGVEEVVTQLEGAPQPGSQHCCAWGQALAVPACSKQLQGTDILGAGGTQGTKQINIPDSTGSVLAEEDRVKSRHNKWCLVC